MVRGAVPNFKGKTDILNYNLFTSMENGNQGVYWELEIGPDGPVTNRI